MSLEFARSGSRLMAMGYSSNGAKAFRTFHDQRLGVDCDFTAASSGDEQLCTPRTVVTVIYQDADCTRPATWVWQYDDLAPNDAVSGIPGGMPSCPGEAAPHRDAYRIGQQLSEEADGYREGMFEVREGQCGPANVPGKITPATFELLPIDERELVRGERVSLKIDDGLRLTRLLADDGAELNLGVTDAAGTACEFQRDGECVPEPIARPRPAAYGKFFLALDVDCAVPAFDTPFLAECGRSKYGVLDDGTAPPRVYSLQRPDAIFGWSIDLAPSDGFTYSCQPVAAEAAYAAHASAPLRDLTGTFPRVDTVRVGDGPLYVEWRTAGGRQLLPALADLRLASPGVVPIPDFVDASGQPCTIFERDDGTAYCGLDSDATSVVWGPL